VNALCARSCVQCHEVRNSLHATLTTTDFLLQNADSPTFHSQREFATTIRDVSEQLMAVVTDALGEFAAFGFEFVCLQVMIDSACVCFVS
jgi:hypothetical protein